MLISPKLQEKYQELSPFEKGYLQLKYTRNQLISILSTIKFISSIPATMARVAINSITNRGEAKKCYEDNYFIDDLREFKACHEVGENTKVAYIGCGNDSSVASVIPETIHLDIDPNRSRGISDDFSFMQADACDLPFDNSSIDVAVFSYFMHELFNTHQLPQELQRILKPDGKILIKGNVEYADFYHNPENTHELGKRGITLSVLHNFYKHKFRPADYFLNGTILLEKGQVNDDEKNNTESLFRQNRQLFYRLIESLPFYKRCKLGATDLSNILGLPVSYESDVQFENILGKIRTEVSSRTFKIIQAIINRSKKD